MTACLVVTGEVDAPYMAAESIVNKKKARPKPSLFHILIHRDQEE